MLDFVVFKEVCENLFEDLKKLVEARHNPIHTTRYEEKWIELRERVDKVMRALQKPSVEAQDQTVNNWFQEVVRNLKEVEVSKDKTKLYISDSPFFMDTSAIISIVVQDDLNLS